jgi:hypothetical protein
MFEVPDGKKPQAGNLFGGISQSKKDGSKDEKSEPRSLFGGTTEDKKPSSGPQKLDNPFGGIKPDESKPDAPKGLFGNDLTESKPLNPKRLFGNDSSDNKSDNEDLFGSKKSALTPENQSPPLLTKQISK